VTCYPDLKVTGEGERDRRGARHLNGLHRTSRARPRTPELLKRTLDWHSMPATISSPRTTSACLSTQGRRTLPELEQDRRHTPAAGARR